MPDITEQDRAAARKVCIRVFSDLLSEDSQEFLAIAEAIAEARTGSPVPEPVAAPEPAAAAAAEPAA